MEQGFWNYSRIDSEFVLMVNIETKAICCSFFESRMILNLGRNAGTSKFGMFCFKG